MAPKKKKGGKKKKEEKTPDEKKLAKFKIENEMLKLSVYNQTDSARRVKIERQEFKEKFEEALETNEQTKSFGQDVAESLTRALNETKAKKELDEHDLKSQINSLLRKIEQLETVITDERAARKDENEEKNEKIRILQNRVNSMEEIYQNVLSESFDRLGQDINGLQSEYEIDALDYLSQYGNMLLDMGLSPADLKSEFSNIKNLRI